MPVSVFPVSSKRQLGAEVEGLDLHSGVPKHDMPAVLKALDDHAVLVIRDQVRDGRMIGEAEQLAFAQQFGPLDASYRPAAIGNVRPGSSQSYGEVSNVDADGNVWSSDDARRWFLAANAFWHSDTSYKTIPTWVTLLSAHEVPPKDGQTEFADMRAAWEDLPADTKAKIDGLKALHSIFHSREMAGFNAFTEEDRAAAPPVAQPLVRTNPRTGKKSLYLSSHASLIVGWPEAEGQKLLLELTEHATQRKYVYSHEWRVGDVVVWDNSATMHRARPFEEFKYRRVLKRTSVNELQAPV